MKFTDIDTEEQARELTGYDVYFPRALADEDDGAPSVAQIIGYTVIDADTEQTIGKLKAVDNATINTLFLVDTPDGQEVLIPATGDLVTTIDSQRQLIAMHIPEGLLGL